MADEEEAAIESEYAAQRGRTVAIKEDFSMSAGPRAAAPRQSSSGLAADVAAVEGRVSEEITGRLEVLVVPLVGDVIEDISSVTAT